MPLSRETDLYRRDVKSFGKLVTAKERETILRPYLPTPKSTSTSSKPSRKQKPIRTLLKTALHFFLFALIHVFFSLYIRVRQYYHAVTRRISAILYYHHHTPELIQKDVKNLGRLPKHLSVILELSSQDTGLGGLDVLLDNVAEISAWCASVGIPMLSVYEKTGLLKSYIPTTHKTVASKLHSYFGIKRPSLQVRAPHMPTFLNGDTSEEAHYGEGETSSLGHISLLLLSADDGRSTLVDLTKTLAEMAQHNKISPSDINAELIDAEISESVMGEPDLLMLFGPDIKLDGYPPWQLRLTEIFHEPDNQEVEYLVWLKGLHRFAKAQMRFGR